MTHGWFITGTDTGVGKTAVAEALLRALGRAGRRALGMKPVASGSRRTPAGLRNDDAERLQAAGSVAAEYADINPYAFEPAIAPHLAAAQAGVDMQLDVIQQRFGRLAAMADYIVMEGAGGWRVPIDRRYYMSDVARALGLPVVLVVGMRLGCINHALLTAEAIRVDGVRLAGWVANRIDPAFIADPTIDAIGERLGAPLAVVAPAAAGSDVWHVAGDALLARLLGKIPD